MLLGDREMQLLRMEVLRCSRLYRMVMGSQALGHRREDVHVCMVRGTRSIHPFFGSLVDFNVNHQN